jgi:hypothetical protein
LSWVWSQVPFIAPKAENAETPPTNRTVPSANAIHVFAIIFFTNLSSVMKRLAVPGSTPERTD